MIKIGNILIEPNDISSIHRDMKPPISDKDRGFEVVQIIYKSGVVKNITTAEIGLSYFEFIDELLKSQERYESNKILRMLTAINTMQNGKSTSNS